jgi:hypothetical protein
MKIFSVLSLLLLSVASAAAQTTPRPSVSPAQKIPISPEGAPQQMTVSFSFRGTSACNGSFESPELRLKDVPSGATWILVHFAQRGTELGGQEVPLPRNGILPAGSIRTWAPCNPDTYSYSVAVKSAAGLILAKAQQSRSFPSDKIAD